MFCCSLDFQKMFVFCEIEVAAGQTSFVIRVVTLIVWHVVLQYKDASEHSDELL